MNKVGLKLSRWRKPRESSNIYWDMKKPKQKPHSFSLKALMFYRLKLFLYFFWKVFFYCYICLWYLCEFIFMNIILDSFVVLCSGHVQVGKKFWRFFILLSENWSNQEKNSRQQRHKPPSFPRFVFPVVYITLYCIYTKIILGILLRAVHFVYRRCIMWLQP